MPPAEGVSRLSALVGAALRALLRDEQEIIQTQARHTRRRVRIHQQVAALVDRYATAVRQADRGPQPDLNLCRSHFHPRQRGLQREGRQHLAAVAHEQRHRWRHALRHRRRSEQRHRLQITRRPGNQFIAGGDFIHVAHHAAQSIGHGADGIIALVPAAVGGHDPEHQFWKLQRSIGEHPLRLGLGTRPAEHGLDSDDGGAKLLQRLQKERVVEWRQRPFVAAGEHRLVELHHRDGSRALRVMRLVPVAGDEIQPAVIGHRHHARRASALAQKQRPEQEEHEKWPANEARHART